MKLSNRQLLIYPITPARINDEKFFLEKINEVLLSGVSILQLRLKNLHESSIIKLAQKVKLLTDLHNVHLIINDYVDIAKEINACGVHIGQNDGTIAEAKQILGDKKIIGVSVSNLSEAKQAEKDGATYLGVGTIFPTNSKTDASIVSFEELKLIVNNVNIPVVAIGGIKLDNIEKFTGINIAGVAIISDIFESNEIREHISKIRSKLSRVIKDHD
ncbi:MAG: thiamine phosphate synthase [Mycoplasma sp.]